MQRSGYSPLKWLEKLFFTSKQGFQKSDNVVHPCIINGQEAIVYKKGLKERNPVFYAQLQRFAQQNNIFLKEDQRGSFRRVKNDRRSGLMPMMVLGASLLTQNVAAAGKSNGHHIHDQHQSSQYVTAQIETSSRFDTEEQLQIADLLQWIYAQVHSVGIDVPKTMPDIKRVNAHEMYRVAYGKDMPRAMSEKNMQIYGLYNFHNKTVYILDSIDLATEKGKSILLHELVHYVQYENDHDQRVDCKNKLENLAYHLEARYLHEHGEHVGFTKAHVERVSRCG